MRAARGHGFGFIDDEAGQIAVVVEQAPEALEHLFIREPSIALSDHSLCREENLWVDNRLECVISPNPHFWTVFDPILLQLEGAAIIDVIADVLFVRQNLMNGSPSPGLAKISRHASLVELCSNLALDLSAVDELAIHPPNGLDFLLGTADEAPVTRRPLAAARAGRGALAARPCVGAEFEPATIP